MSVNLSVKNVPDDLAARLRARAARHHRSLQRELLSILERAAGDDASGAPVADDCPIQQGPIAHVPKQHVPTMTIDQIAARARARFPQGTERSVAWLRELRDSR